MRRSSYRERDYAFGQAMFSLRSAIGLTQAGLADFLGVTRRAVGDWEAGNSYPKVEHLKLLIKLALQQRVFHAGREVEEIRALWAVARQKVLLDEVWLGELLETAPAAETQTPVPEAAPSEPSERPSASSRGASSGIPVAATSLVGRDAELAEIAKILSDPACRLLTLLGTGGVGKTRLAIEVAARHSDAFADGVAFVALSSVGTPNEIVSAIAESLKISYSGQADASAFLIHHLRDRRMLLVLDNFEHLLDGAALVYEMLERAPGVIIMVTSRERLNLRAEWLFDVEGLTYPPDEPRGRLTAKRLTDYSAVQLFIQRAAQVQPQFPLTEATLWSIVRICQHVAGIPLAIELAAAGVRMLGVEQIEQLIRSNLDALSTTLRDVPARHRSVRAVFDHSWNLLTEPEQALFSRVAVFRGGFYAEAASQVSRATLPALMTLADKSLLRLETDNELSASMPSAQAESSTETRFVMLEPIREYALEKLVERGEAEVLQRAHADYYVALSEAAATQWDSPHAEGMVKQLKRELDNLRAVLIWARDGGDRNLGLQLAGAIWRFWRSYGDGSEGRRWLDELLALDDAPDLTMKMRALLGAAWIASDQHDFARATELFEQSMALHRAANETQGEINLLINAARQARVTGQYPRATALVEESLRRHRMAGNRGSVGSAGLGLSLYELALMLREQGEFERAAALFEECIDLHRELDNPEGIVMGRLGLSDIARDMGDPAGVRKYCDPSLSEFREVGMQWAIGFALNNLALAAYMEADLSGAFTLVSESIAMFRSQQADASLDEVLITLGHVLLAQGDVVGAAQAYTETLRLAWTVGPYVMVAAALEGLAGAKVQQGQAQAAVRLLSAAAALRGQMGTPMRPADRPAAERTLAAARRLLSEEVVAAQWASMQSLTLEQIFSYRSFDSLLTLAAASVPPAADAVIRRGSTPRESQV